MFIFSVTFWAWTNTLAYYDTEFITAVKSFTLQDLLRAFIKKLFRHWCSQFNKLEFFSVFLYYHILIFEGKDRAYLSGAPSLMGALEQILDKAERSRQGQILFPAEFCNTDERINI